MTTPLSNTEELERKIFELVSTTGQEFMKTKVLKDWTLAKDIMPLITTYADNLATERAIAELERLVQMYTGKGYTGLLRDVNVRIATLKETLNTGEIE